ncbi:hypothetical protein Tco_0179354 [Tanacetum coccineum]
MIRIQHAIMTGADSSGPNTDEFLTKLLDKLGLNNTTNASPSTASHATNNITLIVAVANPTGSPVAFQMLGPITTTLGLVYYVPPAQPYSPSTPHMFTSQIKNSRYNTSPSLAIYTLTPHRDRPHTLDLLVPAPSTPLSPIQSGTFWRLINFNYYGSRKPTMRQPGAPIARFRDSEPDSGDFTMGVVEDIFDNPTR